MFSRLGIGARLFIAFLAIAALSLSPGVVGWLILREISSAQSRVNEEALPIVAAAQRTAEASARLVATAPSLNAATGEGDRLATERELARLTVAIRSAMAEAQRSSADRAAMRELSGAVDRLTANLSRQSALVKERIQLSGIFAGRNERTIEAATAIVDLSETLVSNASSGASAVVANLYGLIEEPALREAAFDALDRLIEQDIYLLDRMFELRLRSSLIGLLANRLTRTASPEEGDEIARDYQRHLTVVARRIRSIDDPVRRAQASEHLKVLQQGVGDTPFSASLFAQRARLVAIERELQALSQANQELSARLNQVVQGMLQSSQAFALATARQAGQALDFGLYALLASSLAAIALSGLIVWLYVERQLVRRLVGLTGAMRRLGDGDLGVTVPEGGAGELRAMTRAVRVFRDEMERRRELEAERERTNEELRRHREELRQLVAERTEQLTLTNRRLQEEAVSHAEARERAESASRAKSEFLATMSHEIRTPMTGMLGMVRVLADSELDPRQREHLSIIASSGGALLGILDSILDYSKIELGKVVADPVDFDLAATLEGIVTLMRTTAGQKGLELALELEPALWPHHRGDAGKLRQIVFNLVSNAVKFTETGRVRVAALVQEEGLARQTVAIRVTDTGIGIAPEHMDRIFEAFSQTDASITRRFGGTGLGLAISRKLAVAIGGDIAVRSEVGSGSTFTLIVPLERGGMHPDTVSASARTCGRTMPRLRILVVEDDEATRLVTATFLERMGHTVDAVADGSAAARAALSSRPDLVFMDISLPGMDGIEAARLLRERLADPGLPVIAMSAHVFPSDIARHLAAGMTAFVGKPLTPETLADAIARAARRPPWPSSAAAPTGSGENGRSPGSGDAAASLSADVAALGAPTVRRLVDIARATLPERFAAMREAVGNGDRSALARQAHATASAAGSVGLGRLLNAATLIEREAATAEPAALRLAIDECEASFAAAAREWELVLGRQTA